MQTWIEIRKKPIQIGKCSRGFIIPKQKLRLESSKKYVIKIIEESNYYDIPKNELTLTKKIQEVDKHATANSKYRTST